MTDLTASDRRPESGEAARLAALNRYRILDTVPEADFDDIARIAAQICDVPIALISLVDERRQWFKAAHGIAASETPRAIAFCAHAITQPSVLIVADATRDARFADNPLVREDPTIRFYAGAPLTTPDGYALGTLCVIDRRPRDLTEDQIAALEALSRQVMALLELRRLVYQRTETSAEKNDLINRLQSLLEEKDLMIQEVHHRVKNSLATVQSLLRLQARSTSHPDAAQQLEESAGRIHTFGALHEHLYRVGAASHVDIAVYLRSLVEDQQSAFASALEDRTITLETTSALWPSSDAPILGMVLLELVTNALKYGAGTVSVRLQQTGDDAELTVEDEGTGLPADFDPARSKGLGMRVITRLLRGHGRLDIDRARGHTCFVARLTVRRMATEPR